MATASFKKLKTSSYANGAGSGAASPPAPPSSNTTGRGGSKVRGPPPWDVVAARPTPDKLSRDGLASPSVPIGSLAAAAAQPPLPLVPPPAQVPLPLVSPPAQAPPPPVEVASLFNLSLVHCPHCKELMVDAIYQCSQGVHIACEECWKRGSKWCACPVGSVTFQRSKPLERMVGSFHITCKNVFHGCKENPRIQQKKAHESVCMFSPLQCVACDFKGIATEFSSHFTAQHSLNILEVADYNVGFGMKLAKASTLTPIRVGKTLFLLHLQHCYTSILYMTFVAPVEQETAFAYHLSVLQGNDRLSIEGTPRSISRDMATDIQAPSMFMYLCVPLSCNHPEDGHIKVEVCIKPRNSR